MQFVRCKGKNACLEDEVGCRTCGRSHAEIIRTRELIDQIAGLVLDQGYENDEEFIHYLAEKALKSVRHRRENPAGAVA